VLYSLARPLLFALDAERAHRLTLAGLDFSNRLGITKFIAGRAVHAPLQVMGLRFPNAVGLAAGLDKNGEHVDALAELGFGFIEVGTVTPRPQPGNNPKRLFRVVRAQALINRMGFNNHGVEKLAANVRSSRYTGVLGVNIGKNFDTPIDRALDDYVHCLRAVYDFASYVALNISSPNTQDLRSLQEGNALENLLSGVAREREVLARTSGRRVPLAVKIAPDLNEGDVRHLAEVACRNDVDAIIATNTTVSRSGIENLPHANEAGGLSGAPLQARSTEIIRLLSDSLSGRLPVIAVGGIMCGADAVEKYSAGATLVQLYTGLIYRGPKLVSECARALAVVPESPKAN
jgi:dihydroorotate dehydrogenase